MSNSFLDWIFTHNFYFLSHPQFFFCFFFTPICEACEYSRIDEECLDPVSTKGKEKAAHKIDFFDVWFYDEKNIKENQI